MSVFNNLPNIPPCVQQELERFIIDNFGLKAREVINSLARLGRELLNSENFAIFDLAPGDEDKIRLLVNHIAEGRTIFVNDTSFRNMKITVHGSEITGLTGFLAQADGVVNLERDELLQHPCYTGRRPSHLPSGQTNACLSICIRTCDGKLLGLLKAENKIQNTDTGLTATQEPFRSEDEVIIQAIAEIARPLLFAILKNEKLAQLEQAYKHLGDYSPACIYQVDVHGRIVYANEKYCTVHGQKLVNILNKTPRQLKLFSENLLEGYERDDKSVYNGVSIVQKEPHLAQGKKFDVKVIKVPIYDADRTHVIGIQGLFYEERNVKGSNPLSPFSQLGYEQSIMSKENQFYRLADNNPDPILFHKNETIFYANKAADRLFEGVELKQKNLLSLIHQDEQETARAYLDNAKQSKTQSKPHPLLLNFLQENGTEGGCKLVDITHARLTDDGKFFSVLRDFTFTQAIVDAAPCLIFIKEAYTFTDQSGRERQRTRFTFVNKYLAELYGKTVEDLIKRNDRMFCESETECESFEEDDLAIINGVTKRIEKTETVTCKNEKHLYRTIKVPHIDAAGNRQVLGISFPIDELEMLTETLDEVPVGVFIKNSKHQFTQVNATMLKFLGDKKRDEVIGKTDEDLIDRSLAESSMDEEKKIFGGGASLKNDEREVTLMGSDLVYYRLISKSLSKDGKNLIGISYPFGKYRYQQMIWHTGALSSLDFAHDIASNLTAIGRACSEANRRIAELLPIVLSFSRAQQIHGKFWSVIEKTMLDWLNVVESEKLDELDRCVWTKKQLDIERLVTELGRFLKTITAQCAQGEPQFESLKQLACGNHDKVPLVNFKSMLDQVKHRVQIGAHGDFASKCEIIVENNIPNEEVIIRGEKRWIMDAIEKHLSNAVRATANHKNGRSNRVVMSLDFAYNSKEKYSITIEDSGPGYPVHIVSEDFDIPIPRQAKSGLGIGLAISRAIVDILGGRTELTNITVDGPDGIKETSGAKACIILPKAANNSAHS